MKQHLVIVVTLSQHANLLNSCYAKPRSAFYDGISGEERMGGTMPRKEVAFLPDKP